jgi:hypothetical protein
MNCLDVSPPTRVLRNFCFSQNACTSRPLCFRLRQIHIAPEMRHADNPSTETICCRETLLLLLVSMQFWGLCFPLVLLSWPQSLRRCQTCSSLNSRILASLSNPDDQVHSRNVKNAGKKSCFYYRCGKGSSAESWDRTMLTPSPLPTSHTNHAARPGPRAGPAPDTAPPPSPYQTHSAAPKNPRWQNRLNRTG